VQRFNRIFRKCVRPGTGSHFPDARSSAEIISMRIFLPWQSWPNLDELDQRGDIHQRAIGRSARDFCRSATRHWSGVLAGQFAYTLLGALTDEGRGQDSENPESGQWIINLVGRAATNCPSEASFSFCTACPAGASLQNVALFHFHHRPSMPVQEMLFDKHAYPRMIMNTMVARRNASIPEARVPQEAIRQQGSEMRLAMATRGENSIQDWVRISSGCCEFPGTRTPIHANSTASPCRMS